MQSDSKQVPESDYVSMDDESEAERLRKFQPQEGLGEALTYEDIKSNPVHEFNNYSYIPFADER